MINETSRILIADSISSTARSLMECAQRVELIAVNLSDTGDPEYLTDYMNAISNLWANLRIDIPTARYIRYAELKLAEKE